MASNSRFRLRLEPEDGGVHELIGTTVRIGRRSDNEIVLRDSSVSGHHAEIRIAVDHVLLVDLGSTNGIRVEGEKVEERRLAHGDRVTIGSVRAVFEDGLLASDAPVPAPARVADGGDDELLRAISGEHVARAGSRTRAIGLVLGIFLAAAVFFVVRVWLPASEGDAQVAVVTVEGNLFPDPSFESEDPLDGWTPDVNASVAWDIARGHANSGGNGLGAPFQAGEWALARSAPISVSVRRGLVLRAAVWVEREVDFRLGIELSSSRDEAPPTIAWGPLVNRTEGFQDVVLRFDGLPGYDRGRMIFTASATGEGGVSIDDVVLLQDNATGGATSWNEFEGRVLGRPGASAALVRSGRTLFPHISAFAVTDKGWSSTCDVEWTVSATDSGLRFSGLEGCAELFIEVNTTLPQGQEPDGWIATIGPDGYRSLPIAFEVDSAHSILLGRGLDLFRIGFDREVGVTSTVVGDALRLRIASRSASSFEVQTSFAQERAEGARLRDVARAAELEGHFGRALGAWKELLDRVPFESRAVEEAERAQAQLIQQGLEKVAELQDGFERARFFALADMHEVALARARELARAYAPSEVEVEALAVAAAIEADLQGLGGDASAAEDQALSELAEVLEQDGSTNLAARVRKALDRRKER